MPVLLLTLFSQSINCPSIPRLPLDVGGETSATHPTDPPTHSQECPARRRELRIYKRLGRGASGRGWWIENRSIAPTASGRRTTLQKNTTRIYDRIRSHACNTTLPRISHPSFFLAVVNTGLIYIHANPPLTLPHPPLALPHPPLTLRHPHGLSGSR